MRRAACVYTQRLREKKMSQKLKVVTIGGGSSYTPELLEGF
jgi:6-phospho-beta-glucosidase